LQSTKTQQRNERVLVKIIVKRTQKLSVEKGGKAPFPEQRELFRVTHETPLRRSESKTDSTDRLQFPRKSALTRGLR